MNKDTALDLALEALETPRPTDSYPPLWRSYKKTINDAITAIKQARSAPVQEPVGVFREDDDIGHVDLIPHQQMKLKDGDLVYAAPPKAPVQEPVAWTVSGKITDWSKDFSAYQTKHYTRPVYTQPAAQRQWVGLTEQEWERLVELYGDDPDILVRETEAKLKEKNNG